MTPRYQIVFLGSILSGFDPLEVRGKFAERLKVAPEMIERIFSGQRVIFKKGLSEVAARQYLDTLAKLGMEVELEAVGDEGRELILVEPAAVTVPEQPVFDPERIGSNLAHAQALLDRIAAVPLSA